MHQNSQLLFQKYARDLITPEMRVLEIGPDRIPTTTYSELCGPRVGHWHTIDMRFHASITFHSVNEYEFPIANDAYDVVLSGQVIEHVRKIWRWMPELARVCKPGGLIITINPVSWPYHEEPFDCWRIYPEGMKALSDDAGIDVVLSKDESLEPGVVDTITVGRKRVA